MPLRFTIGTTPLLANTASEALRTRTARQAPVGAELRNEHGVTIACKERVDVGVGGEIESWLATDAWSDPVPPVSLEALVDLLDEVDEDEPAKTLALTPIPSADDPSESPANGAPTRKTSAIVSTSSSNVQPEKATSAANGHAGRRIR
jgi:hypothetical protein